MIDIKKFGKIEEVYILIQLPFIQELMEYDWFDAECFLHQALENQDHLDSAYFVPLLRLQQIQTTE